MPVSSSRLATMGTATPSTMGIILSVVACRRAICTARSPPETPP
ncbi:hypothetical protein ACFSTJ_03055 [Ottowia pentelensis]